MRTPPRLVSTFLGWSGSSVVHAGARSFQERRMKVYNLLIIGLLLIGLSTGISWWLIRNPTPNPGLQIVLYTLLGAILSTVLPILIAAVLGG
jgi:hypothetical protein